MDEKEYIERNAVIEEIESLSVTVTGLRAGNNLLGRYAKHYKESVIRLLTYAPAADVVPRAACEQMKWERDVAMQQLSDAGIPFCGEMGGKRDEFFDRYLGKPVGECMCREKRVIQNGRDDSKEDEQ